MWDKKIKYKLSESHKAMDSKNPGKTRKLPYFIYRGDELDWENFPNILPEEYKHTIQEDECVTLGNVFYECVCGDTSSVCLLLKRDTVVIEDYFCKYCGGTHKFFCSSPCGLDIAFYQDSTLIEIVHLNEIEFVPYYRPEPIHIERPSDDEEE